MQIDHKSAFAEALSDRLDGWVKKMPWAEPKLLADLAEASKALKMRNAAPKPPVEFDL